MCDVDEEPSENTEPGDSQAPLRRCDCRSSDRNAVMLAVSMLVTVSVLKTLMTKLALSSIDVRTRLSRSVPQHLDCCVCAAPTHITRRPQSPFRSSLAW